MRRPAKRILKKREAAEEKKWQKKQTKIAKRNFRKEYKGWTRVKCQAICGCCEAEFLFESRERAEAACKEAYLKHAEITDDTGHTETVDGFYGFDLEDIAG